MESEKIWFRFVGWGPTPSSNPEWRGLDPPSPPPLPLEKTLATNEEKYLARFKKKFPSDPFCGWGHRPIHVIIVVQRNSWDKKWRHSIHKTGRQAHFIDKSTSSP